MGQIPGAKAKTNDRKRQPGAYLSRGGVTLYRVVGPINGMLRVENALTGNQVSLTEAEVVSAKYVRGPETLDVPDYPPDDTLQERKHL